MGLGFKQEKDHLLTEGCSERLLPNLIRKLSSPKGGLDQERRKNIFFFLWCWIGIGAIIQNIQLYYLISGFPGSSADKESTCTAGIPVKFLSQEDPLEKGQATHSSILGLPCGSTGKEFTCTVGDLGWGDPLEIGKATHSRVLAWRIPWTIQFIGPQRVGHD